MVDDDVIYEDFTFQDSLSLRRWCRTRMIHPDWRLQADVALAFNPAL